MIARIIDALHPEQLWLFGSRARGDARGDSDWDFMAILSDGAPEQDLEIVSVWKRLRDLRLQRVDGIDRRARSWRLIHRNPIRVSSRPTSMTSISSSMRLVAEESTIEESTTPST